MDYRRIVSGVVGLALLLCALAPASALAARDNGGQPVVVQVSDGGFHWRDAGLGAAAGIAVVLMGAGLVLTRQRS
jgi:hypothetical protein